MTAKEKYNEYIRNWYRAQKIKDPAAYKKRIDKNKAYQKARGVTPQRAAYLKKYRANHKKENAESTRRWVKNHPIEAKAIKQRFAKRNPRYMEEYQPNWRGKNYASYLCRGTKGRATKTKREWRLNLEWFKQKLSAGVCEQTGIRFNFDFSIKHPFRPSVDRINSKLGYTPENCQLVCCIFNIAKSNWSNDQLWEFITKAKRNRR